MGNKCDLGDERAVDYKDAKAYADKHNFQYFETSAKTKINVDKAFTKLTQTVYQTKSVDGWRAHAARQLCALSEAAALFAVQSMRCAHYHPHCFSAAQRCPLRVAGLPPCRRTRRSRVRDACRSHRATRPARTAARRADSHARANAPSQHGVIIGAPPPSLIAQQPVRPFFSAGSACTHALSPPLLPPLPFARGSLQLF